MRALPILARAQRGATEIIRKASVKAALAQFSSAFRQAAKLNPTKSTTAINWAMLKRRRVMGCLPDRGKGPEGRRDGL
jgi:hypothetical protein